MRQVNERSSSKKFGRAKRTFCWRNKKRKLGLAPGIHPSISRYRDLGGRFGIAKQCATTVPDDIRLVSYPEHDARSILFFFGKKVSISKLIRPSPFCLREPTDSIDSRAARGHCPRYAQLSASTQEVRLANKRKVRDNQEVRSL
jgi:hypothetical protein